MSSCPLAILPTKVLLENIGAGYCGRQPNDDLDLIGTITLRFQIQEIEIETASGKRTEKKSEILLLWCQRRTSGYQHVDIKYFSQSLQNGLGFTTSGRTSSTSPG